MVKGKWPAFIKHFYKQWPLQALTKIIAYRRQSQPCKVIASSLGVVRVRCFARGHLNAQLGRARNHTGSLPVTSQPALPPESTPNQINVMYLDSRHILVYSVQYSVDLPNYFKCKIIFLVGRLFPLKLEDLNSRKLCEVVRDSRSGSPNQEGC